MENKIISDFLDIIRFRFKDLNNYNYPIYILAAIFILFIFIDSADCSRVFSLGDNYKLILFVFCENFLQLICLSLILLSNISMRKIAFNKFKEVLGFILLTFIILIPVKFLLLFNNRNIIINNIFTIVYIFYIIVFCRGLIFILDINIFKLFIKLVLGYFIFPLLILSLLLISSINLGLIKQSEIKINGNSFEYMLNKGLKNQLKDISNGNTTQ